MICMILILWCGEKRTWGWGCLRHRLWSLDFLVVQKIQMVAAGVSSGPFTVEPVVSGGAEGDVTDWKACGVEYARWEMCKWTARHGWVCYVFIKNKINDFCRLYVLLFRFWWQAVCGDHTHHTHYISSQSYFIKKIIDHNSPPPPTYYWPRLPFYK